MKHPLFLNHNQSAPLNLSDVLRTFTGASILKLLFLLLIRPHCAANNASRHFPGTPQSLLDTTLCPARPPLATLLGNLMASQRRCWKYRCAPFFWMLSHRPGGDRYVRHRASLSCSAFCPTAGGGIAAGCWSSQL